MTATTATRAPQTLPTRKVAADSQGRKYVLVQRIAISATEKVALRVKIIDNPHPESGRFAESRFDLIRLDRSVDPAVLKTITNAIHQKGTVLTAKGLRAKNLQAACRIALEIPQPGDAVTTRRRGSTARVPAPRTSSQGRASRQAAAQTATQGAELTAAMAASITEQAAARQAAVNARPSEGGGSDVARRPQRNETRTQRVAREKREARAAAKAARDAATTAATASIDTALAENTTAPAATPEPPATQS